VANAPITVNAQVLGNIQITVNTYAAYQELWRIFSKQALLFGSALVIFIALCQIAIYFFLRPLRDIQEQAAAICQRHFIEQQPLPKTLELRRVVEAMNRMSRKLKLIFHEQLALTESLRAQSFLDHVTGLSNRRDFNARMQAIAESESEHCGCLMILQINDFGQYNLQHGHESGDECLRSVSAQLQGLAKDYPDAIISRRSGADFAVYLPRVDQERAKTLASSLIAKIADLALLFNHSVHIGIACCNNLRADHQLLSKADLALRQAQSKGQSGWNLYQDEEIAQVVHESRQWYATLNRVLQERNLIYHFQPMFLRDNRKLMAVEAYCRINVREQLVYAGTFLPMAERFDMSEAFDRMIIQDVCASSEAAHCAVPVCINLSPRSIMASSFVDWLDSFLNDHPAFAKQLIIETSEHLVRTGDEHMRYLCDMLHKHKAKLSLDHFGIHSGAFGYLNSLSLDIIKIDRSFIRNIQHTPDSQFYVRSLIQIAHSCDITVLAEGVENMQEWECLCQIGVDGGQGYLLGKPEDGFKQA
jgi:diguanylate cyclase (GGDEF)-like protein